jgi:ATP-dependent DNA ligase
MRKADRPSMRSSIMTPGEPLHFFIFDLLILRGLDVTDEPLLKRRALIEKQFKTVAGRKYRDYSFRERG